MRIDVHAHYFPDSYLDLLEHFGSEKTSSARDMGAGDSQVELEARFALMDRSHVQMQVLSVSPQFPYFEQKAHSVEAARAVNDLYADLVRRYPTRFAAFAATPLPHVDASLEEMERALNMPGFIGVTMGTSVLGRSLADPAFEPWFAELNRRATVLYIHPEGMGACSPLITPYGLTWPIGAPIEDTIAVTHLIIKGIPQRYPRVKIINSHLGGALPLLIQRLDNQYSWTAPAVPELPSIQARRMWYDTVGHFYIPALRSAYEALGADRLVLGTDFPYLSGELYERSVNYIERAGLPFADAQRILDKNASSVLGIESA
ncbi:amidohydrolase [Ktedonosporobacter rubrisoli]|uniref:Amidohydrolase n=1 Tax=Ktedonosporobacter rubrisoli TaxID=2509675 RepID=A0A4P6JVQ9_KTERU|nr:amidohydrolase family protein [Ktedonosporobacter rubrisoli]QBD79624.1 amidohydrolase [Ktedonosporobacter rubrisoli]